MARKPNVILPSKEGYIRDRMEGYTSWPFAFFRELFQNSVDAGARNIKISIEDVPGRGTFGRSANIENAVRISFTDDGSGMTRETLENVFFRPGRSTKTDGSTVGGFGTARNTICFSQDNYRIQTNGLFVEGDGAEFDIMTASELLEAKREQLAAASIVPDSARMTQLQSELAEIESGSSGDIRGTRFEIDVNPKEGREWRWVTREKLLSALDDYMSMSQIPCNVTLNGEALDIKATKGGRKRELVASMPEGQKVAFASAYESKSERAKHKGKIIVRVHGACMFTEDTTSPHQVIVEIDPSMAREVLTDKRDRLKEPFKASLDGFRSELELDVTSALKETEKKKHKVIRGGRGARKISIDLDEMAEKVAEASQVPGATPDALKPLEKSRSTGAQEVEGSGTAGQPLSRTSLDDIPQEQFNLFIENLRTQLTKVKGTPKESVTLPGMLDAIEGGNPREFIESHEELSKYILDMFSGKPLVDPRYDELNDIHIYAEDLGADDKLKNAMRRWSPDFWVMLGDQRKATVGRGMREHRFLSAWTIACEYALEALKAYEPALFAEKEIAWSTGFLFDKSKSAWSATGQRQIRTEAMHKELDDTHVLLVNPVRDDGTSVFDITKERGSGRQSGEEVDVKGLQELEALALHEVCHIFQKYHNEEFSSLFTGAIGLFDRAASRRKMREVDLSVQAAYGKGKALIQSMDNDEALVLDSEEDIEGKKSKKPMGRRPAEKLLAHSTRSATVALGTSEGLKSEGEKVPAITQVYTEALSSPEPGVVEVDCDKLQRVEKVVHTAAENDWDESISLDAFDNLPLVDVPEPAPVAEAPVHTRIQKTEAPIVTTPVSKVVRPAAQQPPKAKPDPAPAPSALDHIAGLDDMLDGLRQHQTGFHVVPTPIEQHPVAPVQTVKDFNFDEEPTMRDELGVEALLDSEIPLDAFEDLEEENPGMRM